MSTVAAVIPAAGVGKRFSATGKKQFFEFDGRPLLYYTLTALKRAYRFDSFVIGASEEDFSDIRSIADAVGIISCFLVRGGTERSDTVLNAIKAANTEYVLVHDAVRPFITAEIVSNTVEKAFQTGGAICGIFSRDTVKKVSSGTIIETLDRQEIFLAHTPQVFERDLLVAAIEGSYGTLLTDEASAFEHAGHKVAVTESSPDNIKVTVASDLPVVAGLINKYFTI